MRDVHPIAQLLPPMSEREFADLKEDIALYGQREPIMVWREQIIDGVHREKACDELQIECRTREWDGQESDLAAYIMSLNLHRRHLTDSQRAMVMERITAGGTSRDRKDRAESNTISYRQASELGRVGVSAIQQARVVRQRGIPELAEAVEHGQVSVNRAKEIARKPKREQRKELRQLPVNGSRVGRSPRRDPARVVSNCVESIANGADMLLRLQAGALANGESMSGWAKSLGRSRTKISRFITACRRG